MKKRIRVPCSSANLGLDFDVIGLALKASSTIFGPQRFNAVLEVQIEELTHKSHISLGPLNCEIECEGESWENISRAVDKKYASSYPHRQYFDLMLLVSLGKSIRSPLPWVICLQGELPYLPPNSFLILTR